MKKFILRSPAIEPDKMMPEKFIFKGMGHHGQNVSPPLEWEGFPQETKSFALTVVDPDAQINGGWRHWTLINIPRETTSLREGASGKRLLPKEATEIENDFEITHYRGPCPPKGDRPHRYVFTIYALNTDQIHLGPHAERTSVETLLTNNSIGKASFTVRYSAESN